MNRTMVKVSADKETIALRTFSREYRSPQRFFIQRSELEELKVKKRVIVKDIRSFAVMYLYKTSAGLDVIEFEFTWLSDNGDKLSGNKENVRLPFLKLLASIEESYQLESQYQKLLSVPKDKKPKIIFKSKNLHEVIKRKWLRRKLGKFLDRQFNWVDTQSILITDDFQHYSFLFQQYTVQGGMGIWGGIIFHGELKTAYYSIHS